MYKILYSKQALKDSKKLQRCHLNCKCAYLIEILKVNPFQYPPAFEPLNDDLRGFYSRRINRQHRLVYEVKSGPIVDIDGCVYDGKVRILRMCSHYDMK